MYEQVYPWPALLGRFLLSPIFILSGVMKVLNWTQMVESMSNEGMIAVPFLLFMAIVFEIGGGLSMLLGFKARLGALALILFLIPTTLIFHDFWTYEGQAMQSQMQHFMKNLTIMGGLLMLFAAGAGRYALDTLNCCPAVTDARMRQPMTTAGAK